MHSTLDRGAVYGVVVVGGGAEVPMVALKKPVHTADGCGQLHGRVCRTSWAQRTSMVEARRPGLMSFHFMVGSAATCWQNASSTQVHFDAALVG